MAGMATKAALSSTMSSIEKQLDALTTKSSEKGSKQEEETPLTTKEKKKVEKNAKKLAEQKAKHEKEQNAWQSKRAELRNAMRAKYGLGSDEKDNKLIARVESEKRAAEQKEEIAVFQSQESSSPPPWGDSSPVLSTPDSSGNVLEYPEERNPFDDTSNDPTLLTRADSHDNDEFLEKQRQEKELERKKKELEKIEKKIEKKRIKQEEKEKREQERAAEKARKERQKQSYSDWKQRKESQKSIVTEHERKSALYEKYGMPTESGGRGDTGGVAGDSPEYNDHSTYRDKEQLNEDKKSDKDCKVM